MQDVNKISNIENAHGNKTDKIKEALQSKKPGSVYLLAQAIINLLIVKRVYRENRYTTAKMAKALSVDINRLNKIIESYFKTTFIDLISEYRVKEACLILQDIRCIDMNIPEIAHIVGFKSRQAFYTVFNSVMNMTPHQYRQKYMLPLHNTQLRKLKKYYAVGGYYNFDCEDMVKTKTVDKALIRIDNLKKKTKKITPIKEGIRDIFSDIFEIDFTYQNILIEGNNNITREAILRYIEGETVADLSRNDRLQFINFGMAINDIKKMAANKADISEKIIKDLHYTIMDGIDLENAGKYRNKPYKKFGSIIKFPNPAIINEKMEDFILDLNFIKTTETHPVIVAAWIHNQIEKIAPFNFGNGSIARLLMNLHLLKNGYPLLIFKYKDMRVYNKTLRHYFINNSSEDFYIFFTNQVIKTLLM